ncbi:MAG: LysR family transcriptional regulator [Alphaproteobacteria bacterium]|nr:MAG: LysR family transcriptional regulator [Alphaproteobacteria bacterium]
MWTSIELRELRIFMVLADELHFGRTAEQLRLSQARVSQAIQALERKLGGRLFERSSRSVSLTRFGADVRDDVGPALLRLEKALQLSVYHSVAVAGVLRLGIYNNGLNVGPHMTGIVHTFNDLYPDCHVMFVDTRSMSGSLDALHNRDVDLIAARLPLDLPDIAVGPILSRDGRVLLVASDDPLASATSINYDDVGDRPVSQLHPSLPSVLRDSVIPPTTASGTILKRADTPITTAAEANIRVALGELVHLTVHGWSEAHPHPGVVAVPVTDLPPSETALAWRAAAPSSNIEAFASTAEDVIGRVSAPAS